MDKVYVAIGDGIDYTVQGVKPLIFNCSCFLFDGLHLL